MIPFVLSWGNRTKANDNNKSIKLSSSEHISSFCQPTRGLKCTYCTLAPQAAGDRGTHHPLGGQRRLDKWLGRTSLSPVREEPPHSKLHHPNSITLFMPVVDTASCDWRHALHRLIGILNWKNSRGTLQISSPGEPPHGDHEEERRMLSKSSTWNDNNPTRRAFFFHPAFLGIFLHGEEKVYDIFILF